MKGIPLSTELRLNARGVCVCVFTAGVPKLFLSLEPCDLNFLLEIPLISKAMFTFQNIMICNGIAFTLKLISAMEKKYKKGKYICV